MLLGAAAWFVVGDATRRAAAEDDATRHLSRRRAGRERERSGAAFDETSSHAPLVPEDAEAACRRRWEAAWDATYPGTSWGEAKECEKRSLAPFQSRGEWFADAWVRTHNDGATSLARGLEIGACGIPIDFAPFLKVDMTYADKSPNSTVLCMTENSKAVSIVDDAQSLSSVPDDSFDFVAAAHVLEHQPHVLRALRSWLRVVKPGGLVYIIAPDACERTSGDRFRLATRPSHFVHEFLNATLVDEHVAEHMREAAVGAFYFRLGTTEQPTLPECFDGSPQALDAQIAKFRAVPFAAHLHAFTLTSLLDLLVHLRRMFPAAASGGNNNKKKQHMVPFDVVRIEAVRGNGLLHDEVRVALRKWDDKQVSDTHRPKLSKGARRRRKGDALFEHHPSLHGHLHDSPSVSVDLRRPAAALAKRRRRSRRSQEDPILGRQRRGPAVWEPADETERRTALGGGGGGGETPPGRQFFAPRRRRGASPYASAGTIPHPLGRGGGPGRGGPFDIP